MNLRIILFLALFSSLIFELTIISFPLVFVICLISYILYSDEVSLIGAFVAGLILDSINLNPLGLSSVIILSSFLLIDAARRIFEIKDYRLIILILFVTSYAYAVIFSYSSNILIYISVFTFSALIYSYFHKKMAW